MNENRVTVNELISGLITEMQRLGYSEITLWGAYIPWMYLIRNYYHDNGEVYYSLDVTDSYCRKVKERYESGELSREACHNYRKAANRMNEFFLTGTLRVGRSKNVGIHILSEQNERLMELFIATHNYQSKNTRKNVEWVLRRYLGHWEAKGCESMSEVSVDEVRDFIVQSAADLKPASLYNVLLYLKHFHKFLKESGIPAPDCVDLFSYRVYREMPIQGYVTDEELDRILKEIDTSTVAGKRDLAIILLGATTGLRACDIVHMKLSDINWRRGEISLTQAKTGHVICVPLIRETSEALQDYILNARPSSTGCKEVFLRINSPKTEIRDSSTITDMFKFYQRKAGIHREPFDGKGFHGLRRRLAKKLLVSGTPLTTIAQILGHEDILSARQYLSLNTDNLKECALSLSGIPVERRALQ